MQFNVYVVLRAVPMRVDMSRLIISRTAYSTGVWIWWTGTVEWNGGLDWTGMEWNNWIYAV